MQSLSTALITVLWMIYGYSALRHRDGRGGEVNFHSSAAREGVSLRRRPRLADRHDPGIGVATFPALS